ncbi:E3 ubiquitin- ligase ZNRF2-like protein [Labeo rohita]|uniref:E3 ubiquitin-ligase ZNRF2-like protein n=1 Tax=Labeo rohita TaxID=84645 RepID=A0A498MTD6_LABRO|nr:E3 ubiquitin- ligase ZNRF2-like protein [Labeo rohita]
MGPKQSIQSAGVRVRSYSGSDLNFSDGRAAVLRFYAGGSTGQIGERFQYSPQRPRSFTHSGVIPIGGRRDETDGQRTLLIGSLPAHLTPHMLGVLYIAPLQDELDTAPLPPSSEAFRDMPKAICKKCNESYPLQLLTNHIKSCSDDVVVEDENDSQDESQHEALDMECENKDNKVKNNEQACCPICQEEMPFDILEVHASECGESPVNDDSNNTAEFSFMDNKVNNTAEFSFMECSGNGVHKRAITYDHDWPFDCHISIHPDDISLKSLQEMCGRCSLPSVIKVHETLKETNLAQSLNAKMIIMVDKCKIILQPLSIFQSGRPVTTNIFCYLEDLHVSFTANKELQYKACAQYFANLEL